MTTRRPGFTLIELVVVVLIMGILVRIALPAYHEVRLRARAAAIVSDLHTVRIAAYSYFADHDAWPPDVNRGIVPPGLVPYLPDGFSFHLMDDVVLDWDNWMLPDGTPMHSETNVLVGVSLATKEAALGEALANLVGPSALRYTIAEHYTFIIAAQ